MGKKRIAVCFSADDKYAPWLGGCICSVLKNALPDDCLDFYIFEDAISSRRKSELQKLLINTPHQIYFLSVPFDKFPQLELTHDHLSRATFGRLMMGELLPDSLERVIYLDCDVLVLSSLRPLAEIDLHGKVLGAVEDLGVERFRRQGTHPWNISNGPYVNAGILSIDLLAWKKNNTKEKILQYLQRPQYPLRFEDQDALNFVLAKQIQILDPRWNAQMYWLEKDYNNYPPCYRQALESPFIVHFAARTKPWQWGSGWHKHTLQWRKYFKETGWKLESAPPLWPLFKRVMWYWWRHPVCFLNPSFYNQLKSKGRWLFY